MKEMAPRTNRKSGKEKGDKNDFENANDDDYYARAREP